MPHIEGTRQGVRARIHSHDFKVGRGGPDDFEGLKQVVPLSLESSASLLVTNKGTWHTRQLSIFQVLLTSVPLQARVDSWFRAVRQVPQSLSADYRESCQATGRARGSSKRQSRSGRSCILHGIIGSDGVLAWWHRTVIELGNN